MRSHAPRSLTVVGLLAATVLATTPTAGSAQVVNINAKVSGCQDFRVCGGQHVGPGTYVGPLYAPVQLVLGPGTYSLTNGSLIAGSDPYFSSWNYNVSASNWVWEFMAIDDATKRVLVQACCGPVFNSQAGAATQPFAQNYASTLTLTSTTTIDFITEDYIPWDNDGGVSVNVQNVTTAPEPASIFLVGSGLAGLVIVGRRRRGR